MKEYVHLWVFLKSWISECGQQDKSCQSRDYLEAAIPSGIMQGVPMRNGKGRSLYLLEADTDGF